MRRLTRREFALGSAALALSSMARISSVVAAEPPVTPPAGDPLSYVDPELRAKARTFPSGDWSEQTLNTLRQQLSQWIPRPLSDPAYVERRIPGADGEPEVRIYVIGSKAREAPRPAVLHMHSGGYVAGSALQA